MNTKLFKKLSESIESPIKKSNITITEADESDLLFGSLLESISKITENQILSEEMSSAEIEAYKKYVDAQEAEYRRWELAHGAPKNREERKLEKEKKKELAKADRKAKEEARAKIKERELELKKMEIEQKQETKQKAMTRPEEDTPEGLYRRYDSTYKHIISSAQKVIKAYDDAYDAALAADNQDADLNAKKEKCKADVIKIFDNLSKMNASAQFKRIPESYKTNKILGYTKEEFE